MLDARTYESRVDRVQQFLRSSGASFALLTPSPNFAYLTGIHYSMRERLIAVVIPSEGPPSLVVPAFEESNLSRKTWIQDVRSWQEDEDPYDLVISVVNQENAETVALDDALPLGVFRQLRRHLQDLRRDVSITQLLGEMRIRKTAPELELMRRAGHIIADAEEAAFRHAHPGITEVELKRVIEDEIVRQGATPTFAAVQFGPDSALPHAEAGPRELVRGDIVLLDCGCSLDGYNTDMTRVGILGPPSEEQERVYRIVLRAQEAALERLAPGLACGSADGIARRVIEEEGLGEFFTHRLGHGIGLEVHEPPYLVRGNAMALDVGMTHSVEPGVYLEGKFGVRIEDLVVITNDGCEPLTFSPKELRIVEER